MTQLRFLVRRFPAVAALIVVAALALRVAVPTGFMPVVDHGRVTITICTGYGPLEASMPMPGMEHHPAATTQSPCAFADLALPAIGGADPVQLAAALRFILALALVLAAMPAIVAPARLRPPLRAPPASR